MGLVLRLAVQKWKFEVGDSAVRRVPGERRYFCRPWYWVGVIPTAFLKERVKDATSE